MLGFCFSFRFVCVVDRQSNNISVVLLFTKIYILRCQPNMNEKKGAKSMVDNTLNKILTFAHSFLPKTTTTTLFFHCMIIDLLTQKKSTA